MPVIEIVYSEDDNAKLKDEYQKMSATWKRLGRKSLPPTFEQWVGARAVASAEKPIAGGELDDLRVFNAIEKLATSLEQCDVGLGYLARQDDAREQAAADLAKVIVTDLSLPQAYLKRFQDLFEHYLKSGKEIADAAHVGVTNRAYGAMIEAYRNLAERTAESAEHVGQDRAIGRVEGALALLVALDVMDRTAGEKKARAFKTQVRRAARKATWVGKVFGGPDTKA